MDQLCLNFVLDEVSYPRIVGWYLVCVNEDCFATAESTLETEYSSLGQIELTSHQEASPSSMRHSRRRPSVFHDLRQTP